MAWVPVVVTMVICYVTFSDANITITALGAMDDKGNLKCGSKVILMCTIEPFDGNMAWKADNLEIMRCAASVCWKSFHQNYVSNFEVRSGQFNITINQATMEENGVVFACNSGKVSQTLRTHINVLPDKIYTSLTVPSKTTHTNGNVEAKVTTNCVYPAEDVSFEWFYYKVGEDPKPFTFGDQHTGPSNGSRTKCSRGACGGTGFTTMEGTLTFEQGDKGYDYFLQAVVKSSKTTDKIVMNSNTSYKLKVPGMNTSSVISGMGTKTGLVVTLALIGIVVFVVTIVIFFVLVSKRENDPEKKRIVGN